MEGDAWMCRVVVGSSGDTRSRAKPQEKGKTGKCGHGSSGFGFGGVSRRWSLGSPPKATPPPLPPSERPPTSFRDAYAEESREHGYEANLPRGLSADG